MHRGSRTVADSSLFPRLFFPLLTSLSPLCLSTRFPLPRALERARAGHELGFRVIHWRLTQNQVMQVVWVMRTLIVYVYRVELQYIL
ncbi:hypothetical protein MUK42_36715 [Musa troglodytarum]|uniref:Uncharacterized protein n=1 Tax=Musa troglodytarum TaxID=320322 RepID=A0A9E7JC57_9LILI|nr:hypothetical protein MUK42_36715 [Musa troglodytarum]